MEMQITADFSALTAEQREHLAGFILTFPPIPAELQVPGKVVRLRVETEPNPEPDPASAFGVIDPVVAVQQSISAPEAIAGPTLIIPPPPAPAVIDPQNVAERATVEIDKHGLPWDGRIHASTKGKNADGAWKKKRGLDDAALAQVEAELKALMAIPSAGPQLVPAPPAAIPPPPGAPDPFKGFIALMGRASAAMQAKKITEDEIKKCCSSIDPSLVALPLLANRLDLVAPVAALIDGIIAGRSA